MDYKNKYIKYKTKYLELKDIDVNNQIGGGGKNRKPKLLIIMCMLHSKNDYQKGHNLNIDLKSMIKSLKKNTMYTYITQNFIYPTPMLYFYSMT